MQENILAVDLSTEQVLEVNLPEQDNVAQIDVYWQDEVTLDLDLSLMYIVSGQREIQDYVDNKSKPEIDDYIETYAKPIVSEVVEEIAAPVVGDYIENVTKPEIKEFADKEMANYAQVAGEQATIATEKANEASETAKTVDEKIQEFSQTTEASKTEFVNFAQEKTEEFEQAAITATEQAVGSAERSRIWAEGEQAEVEPLGGSLSSMGAADLAYAIANAPEDVPVDTSGLKILNVIKGEKGDKGDKGDAGKDGVDGKSVFDGYATNCITEIPQDIKLGLNDGALTLKAGSRVYVPNGFEADGVTPKFDEVVIESDLAHTLTLAGQWKVVFTNGDTAWGTGPRIDNYNTNIYSGNTAPSVSSRSNLWYDTANNVMKTSYDNGASWVVSNCALPIGLITATTSGVSSIDQVFNGFGYIGSTVFALPNVKGLIPNGRNEDGSLRNIEFTVDKVAVLTFASNVTTPYNGRFLLNSSGGIFARVGGYDPVRNYITASDGVTILSGCSFTEGCLIEAGVIKTFNSKLPFRADGYNDSSWVAGQAMPSGKYINLTLGASGSSYTAPANGWFAFKGQNNVANGLVEMTCNSVTFTTRSANAGNGISVSCPCPKGASMQMYYDGIKSTHWFKFIYAEGEN